jgi:Ca-activated chloride channel family protein
VYNKILIISLTSAPLWLGAQTAEDYFHGGAQHYVFGEKQKAQEQVVTGLHQFPQDEKLNALLALLKKEEEQKQQQQQQQQKENEKKQDQKKDEQNPQQQNKPDQNKDQKQQQQQQEQQKPENKDQQQQAQKDKSDQKDEREQAGQPVPGQMSPQQAKQLLDAQKAEELMVPIRPEVKAKEHAGPLRDW